MELEKKRKKKNGIMGKMGRFLSFLSIFISFNEHSSRTKKIISQKRKRFSALNFRTKIILAPRFYFPSSNEKFSFFTDLIKDKKPAKITISWTLTKKKKKTKNAKITLFICYSKCSHTKNTCHKIQKLNVKKKQVQNFFSQK